MATTTKTTAASDAETTVIPTPASESVAAQAHDEGPVIPGFAPEADDVFPAEAAPRAAKPVKERRPSKLSDQPIRLMLVVAIGVIALFFAFGLLIIFSPTSSSVAALAVIATPIASMVAAYYGITLSMQQVAQERAEREKAVARAEAAEQAAREADVWAAQMESGLRVAKVKLDAGRIASGDVDKAAGVTPDFF